MMIAISILGFILFGSVANFMIRSTKMVSIMLSVQRKFVVEYHQSLGKFYQYTANTDSSDLIQEAVNQLSSANNMLDVVANLDSFFSQPKKQQIDSLVYFFNDVLTGDNPAIDESGNYDPATIKNAELFYSRLKIMHTMKDATVTNTNKAARASLNSAKVILEIFKEIQSDPSKLVQKEHFLTLSIESMEGNELIYQNAVKTIINDIIKIFRIVIVLIVVLIAVIIIFISKKISEMISTPVKAIGDNLKAMAIGNLQGDTDFYAEDEIGQLSESYRRMRTNLFEQIEQAKRVAKGNFEHSLELKSDEDALSQALNHMTHSLKIAHEKNTYDKWFETRQNELSNKLRGDLDLSSLGNKAIAFICKNLNALTGAFFSISASGDIAYSGGYAIKSELVKDKTFKTGEGLIGQVLESKKSLIINDFPDDYLNICSGLGETKPRFLLVLPCLYNDVVHGVIEIASLEKFTDAHLDLVGKLSESIAIAISSARSRTELEKLLASQKQLSEELLVQQEELKQTNEELQVQQEELRQANEELETQTRELEESKEGLQTQQEELRVTNEELAERSLAVESQRDSIKKKNLELEEARNEIELKANDLEQASRYKSEFLANMSHELRTPLNSILVLSQILSQNKPDNLNDKQIKSAQTIHSSGENLLVLINEILDLSKVESGQIDLHNEFVSFSDIINDLQQTFQVLAEEKGLTLEMTNLLKEINAIETDSLRTGQILKNLLSNAIKFTEKGVVRFTIKRPDNLPDYLDSQSSYVAFQVKDTGIGIADDQINMVFEAFKQADGTTARKFGGTGLGLAISRNFSKLMGGDILLTSQKEKGSIFTLILPEKMSPSKTTEKAIESAQKTAVSMGGIPDYTIGTINKKPAKQELTEAQSKPGSISVLPDPEVFQDDRRHITKGDSFLLIIEDDTAFSQILYNLAHEKHFKCMIAPNGEAGLHYADYYGPSAIILDIGLPGIDGWEVMKRLKENPDTRHIPVHFMSGSDKSMEAMKQGAIGFLKKPVSVEQVNNALDSIESLISKPIKNLLIVEDDEIMRESISLLLEEDNIRITTTSNGKEALDLIKNGNFDCMILDLGLDDMTGCDLLKKMGKRNQMPVIIYTGKDLTREEEAQLQSYTDRIIIKGIKSPDRLLAETTLFLHQVESNLPAEKQKILRDIHTKGDVMINKSILIVDDDMRNVFALTSLLEDLGVKIIVGKNGKDGIDKLEANHADLILMDIMMPEMNGYEAMKLIRKQHKYKNLPIIALTAKAMPGDREKCIASGANDYLTKPLDPDKLISMLRVWLYQ